MLHKLLLTTGLILLALTVACGGSEPTATPDPRIDEILDKLGSLDSRVQGLEDQATNVNPTPTPTPGAVMEHPTPTPTHEAMAMETPAPTPTQEAIATEHPTPTPTHEAMATEKPTIQEIGLIENYAATRFFPRWIVVLKDIPVKIYMTRLHREHVNKFTIAPFFDSSEVILPGEIGIIEFLPDQVGEFKISNVGHNFDATLVVVETIEDAKRRIAERGTQMYALIHAVDDFRIFPDRLVLQQGIPARIHNISLIADHQVSFKPFYDPEGINIKPREITPIEFTPDRTGQFTILHELHGFTGELIVEGGS